MCICLIFSLYRLKSCSVTGNDCDALTSALNSNPSHLKELDLSENKLRDSGVNNLCSLLSNSDCKLEKLRCVLVDKLRNVYYTTWV